MIQLLRNYLSYRKNVSNEKITVDSIRAEGFKSQYGQDYVINNLCNGKIGGFFIDIGAHDGVSFSNSYYFEKYKQWKGLLIEPNPSVFDKLVSNRDNDCLNICITNTDGEVDFLKIEGYSEMLSGVVDSYHKTHSERIESEVTKYGGSQNRIKVKSRRLDSILEEKKVDVVDFLSIDTEGAEYNILKSIDLNTCNIRIICIENNYKERKIYNYLNKHGYKLVKIVGSDEIYVK